MHVFVETDERQYMVQCCTDAQLLNDPSYYQSLEVLLSKYQIDKTYFVKGVTEKDAGYFARIMIKGSQPDSGHAVEAAPAAASSPS